METDTVGSRTEQQRDLLASILGQPAAPGPRQGLEPRAALPGAQASDSPHVRSRWPARVVIAAGALGVLALGVVIGRGGVEPSVQPEAVAATPSATVAPIPASAANGLDASGFVVAARRATVSSETTGRLVEVLVKEGDRVRAGQVLARLDPRDVVQQIRLAEAQLDASQRAATQRHVELGSSSERLQRLKTLNAQRFISEDAYKTAEYETQRLRAAREAAEGDATVAQRQLAVQRQRLKNMEIVAPFDGIVSERAAQVGEIVSPISAGGGFTRTGICTLVDMSSVEVRARVNEKHIGLVQVGQSVSLVPRAYPSLRLRGKVVAIMPAAERETASVEVIVGFLDRDERVLPNMSIDVAFLGGTGSDRTVSDAAQVITQSR